ncbi:MAG TPA: hypothetical protein VE133_05650, partial [Candidatus Sulfotelmatobacter sp.]|nr:hypothetical protein [Candidatus Sulfotelmatobacter sp.]
KPAPEPARDSNEQPISKLQIEQMLYVALCGGLGGVLSWLLGQWTGVGVFTKWAWYGQIPALVFLGAMAGLFGIFILTASSLNSMRTYVFAIICGVLWQPIITTALKSVGEASATRQLAQVSNQTEQVRSVVEHGSPEEVSSAVKASVPTLTDALKQLPNVENAEKKDAIVKSSDNALSALESAADKAPASSIEAIRDVGLTASDGNHIDVSLHAVHSLRQIGLAGAKSNHPEVIKAAVESLQKLAVNGKDPALKSAAAASLNEIKAQGHR